MLRSNEDMRQGDEEDYREVILGAGGFRKMVLECGSGVRSCKRSLKTAWRRKEL